jgi:hypothetical protein
LSITSLIGLVASIYFGISFGKKIKERKKETINSL